MTASSFSRLPLCCSLWVALSLPPSAALAAGTRPSAGMGGTLLGVKIGMDRDDAHAALAAAGASSTEKSTAPDKDNARKEDKKESNAGDPDATVPEVWTLKGTPYGKVVFAADDHDKVIWVTGFARPGEGIPFAQLGPLARAAASGQAFAVWNVISPGGSYREIARGKGGKALVVSLLPLRSADPNGAFSPQIVSKARPKSGPGHVK